MPLNPLPPDPTPPTGSEMAAWSNRSRMVSDIGPGIFISCPWLLRHAWVLEGRTDRPDDFRHVAHLETEAEYKVYCKSPLWKSIQKRVLERDGYRCVACGRLSDGVHHRDYRPCVMSGEDIRPIVSLCHRCHDAIHLNKKDAGPEVERALANLVALYEA